MSNINFAWPTSAINRDDMIAFDKWYHYYEEHFEDKIIYIWGAGIRGSEFACFLKMHDNNQFHFVDNNEEKWGGNIDGSTIVSPETAIQSVKDGDAIILISTENDKAIRVQLQSCGLIYDKDFFSASNQEYEAFVAEFCRPIHSEFVVMGDCMFSGISLNDSDQRNLAEMFRETLGDDVCKILYMHGMGIRSYYNIFKLLCENYGVPKVLAVMVNFETLTGLQHLLPRSQHSELFRMLEKRVNKKNDEFLDYIPILDERSENIQTELSYRAGKLTEEQAKLLKARNYIKLNYMYRIDPDTEGLQYLKKLIHFAKQNDVRVYPYVPPVNYELGEKIFGEQFEEAYRSNLDCVQKQMDDLGVELIDFSHALNSDCFAEPDTPDEELNIKGRNYILKALCDKMRGSK